MAKYAVFVDVDGVLTSTRVHIANAIEEMWSTFDPIAIAFFNRLDSQYDIDFVLMSTWKIGMDVDNPTHYHWINSTFRNAGFRGRFPHDRWRTNPTNKPTTIQWSRPQEVQEYLENWPYQDWLLFDDDYDFNAVLQPKRHIKTDPHNGLLVKHMQHAMSIVGNWDPK